MSLINRLDCYYLVIIVYIYFTVIPKVAWAAIDPVASGKIFYNGVTLIGQLSSGFDTFYDYNLNSCGTDPVRVQVVYTFTSGSSYSNVRIYSGTPILSNSDDISQLGVLQGVNINYSVSPEVDQNGWLTNVCYTYSLGGAPFNLGLMPVISFP